MYISERIVTSKRHTAGYVISGKEYTRNQAVKLTRQGKVENARVVRGIEGTYLMGRGFTSLYDLPVRLDRKSAKKR